MAMMPLHSRHILISCNITATTNTSSIGIYYICFRKWHISHICVHRWHMYQISWCLIDTMPLHLSAHFSCKLFQYPFISQHKRSLDQLAIMCPSISMARYRSRVYYNHIHSNNVKYHNDNTSDIQWIVHTR